MAMTTTDLGARLAGRRSAAPARCAAGAVGGPGRLPGSGVGTALPVPRPLPAPVRHLRAGARSSTACGSACTSGTSCCPGKPFVGLQNYIDLFTPGSMTSRAVLERRCGPPAIFTVLSVPLLVVLPAGRRRAAEQEVPGPQRLPGRLLRPVRPRCRRHRPAVALPARPQRRRRQLLPRPARASTGSPAPPPTPWVWAALVVPDDLVDGSATTWSSSWPACRTSRAELYEAAEVDGANALAAVPQRHPARAAPGDGLRPHDHDPGLGQRVRPALPHHPGPARATRPARRSCRSAEEGLRDFNMGSAAAMSTVLTLALLLISVANFLLVPRSGPKEH